MIPLGVAIASLAFTLSAAAGLGGSLILVPAFALLLGAKEGIAVSALLLALNNVAKVAVYRDAIPVRGAALVAGMMMLGSAVGARLLLAAPLPFVRVAVPAVLVWAVVSERRRWHRVNRASAPVLAFGAGAVSGLAGMSGPLKAVAIRSLGYDRLRFVGAASLVSLCGDAAKAAVLARAFLLPEHTWAIVAYAVPVMPLAAFLGRRINRKIGEQVYARLFWSIMAVYSIRLLSV